MLWVWVWVCVSRKNMWPRFRCYDTGILTTKLSPYYFTYLLFNLRYNRTITRFTADDKVVYHRVRWKMQLASDNSWVRRSLKHLSWKSRWIILCTLEQRLAVSCVISQADRCLFGLSSWLSTRSSTATHRTRSTTAWLPDNIVPILWILFCRLSMFPTVVTKFTQQPSCTILLWQIVIFKRNCIIASSCEIFMILFNFISI